MSPMSGGSTPSYFHTLSDFSKFNIPGKDNQYPLLDLEAEGVEWQQHMFQPNVLLQL